jgi:acyl-CoA thioester hydrolase
VDSAVFVHPIGVKPTDIDAMGHVNNVVYLQWVQDAAAAHWQALADAHLQKQYNWVVLRHEIDYQRPAFLHDVLEARTWVQSYAGVRSVRVVQIVRTTDQHVLAEARTTWCLVSAATGRPSRISEAITQVLSPVR